MIDIIFFKSIGIFAKVWSPVSETLHTQARLRFTLLASYSRLIWK